MSVSFQSGATVLERWYGWNIKLYRNGKIHSLFQPYHLSSTVAPLWKETDIFPRWRSCPKFDAEKLLFKTFFRIMCIFGGVQPKSECNFPFPYNLIFQLYHLSSPLAPLQGAGWLTYSRADFFLEDHGILWESPQALDPTGHRWIFLEDQKESRSFFFTILHTPDGIMPSWHHHATIMENTASESRADLLCIGSNLLVLESIHCTLEMIHCALKVVFRAPQCVWIFGKENPYA